MNKKFITMLLALAMLVSMVPMSVFADETVEVPYLCDNHWWNFEEVPATCTEDGYKITTCKNEGCDFYNKQVLSATGHWWNFEEVPATCTEDGYKITTCKHEGCDFYNKQILEATGEHKLEMSERVFDCDKGGYEIYNCSNPGCDYMEKTELERCGHIWNFEEVPATCTEDGYKITTCKNEGCDFYNKQIIEAAGEHKYEVTSNTATCEKDGILTETCTVCGNVKTSSAGKTGHAYDSGVVTKKPTYFSEGEIVYTCAHDNTHTYTEVLPKLVGASTAGLDSVPKTGSALVEWLFAALFD